MLQTQIVEKAPTAPIFRVSCPICPTDFRDSSGLVWHMVLDHWWERAAAEEYCAAGHQL
jgi:hypothetical protein